jgi:hypothetical protein
LVDIARRNVVLSLPHHAGEVVFAHQRPKIQGRRRIRNQKSRIRSLKIAEGRPATRIVLEGHAVRIHPEHELPIIAHPAVEASPRGSRQAQGGADEFPIPLDVTTEHLDGLRREHAHRPWLRQGRIHPHKALPLAQRRRHLSGGELGDGCGGSHERVTSDA